MLSTLFMIGDHAGRGTTGEDQLTVGTHQVWLDESEKGEHREQFVPLYDLLLGETGQWTDRGSCLVLRGLEMLSEDMNTWVVERLLSHHTAHFVAVVRQRDHWAKHSVVTEVVEEFRVELIHLRFSGAQFEIINRIQGICSFE